MITAEQIRAQMAESPSFAEIPTPILVSMISALGQIRPHADAAGVEEINRYCGRMQGVIKSRNTNRGDQS